jgi:hypothetical protein
VVLLAPRSAMKTREANSRREEDMVFLEQGRSVLFTGEEKRYVSLYPPCDADARARSRATETRRTTCARKRTCTAASRLQGAAGE